MRGALVVVVLGCGVAVAVSRGVARGPRTARAGGADKVTASFDRELAARFEALRVEAGELTYAELVKRLGLARAPNAPLSFDPTRVEYWDKVRDKLKLTREEQQLYRQRGMVAVNHDERYAMASAYLTIYQRDLPVLITTDSILHALHRSYDGILAELEVGHFAPAISEALSHAQDVLGEAARDLPAGLRQNAEDVDLYLTVARNLGAEPTGERLDAERRAQVRCVLGEEGCDDSPPVTPTGGLQVPSLLGQDQRARAVLAAVSALQPGGQLALYGREGVEVDWSQFTPRGHYTKSPQLRRYFQMMMWLGRADLGFVLGDTARAFGSHDAPRERVDAALLAWVLRQSGYLAKIAAMDKAIGFFVGTTDDVTVADMVAAAEQAGVRGFNDLADVAKLNALPAMLERRGAGVQRIRSERGARPRGSAPETPLSHVMQVFGQRFVIDSFILSKVVFDAIHFDGRAQERQMPSGLDVAAALGNDEAVALLQPELERWNYGANLLAARRIVEERPPGAWNASLYDLWLSALSKLDDLPAKGNLPEVMRGQAWQRKQLQAQLGSWSELRHDTILYAKQSYTMGILCEYPTGYVEPYPEVFERLALFTDEARRRMDELHIGSTRVGPFLSEFGTTMRKLAAMARKELAGEPFDAAEKQFVKDAIQAKTEQGGGCGPPRVSYTGWYPKLLYDGAPGSWEPTIADVHTDPTSGQVLEVGVGDASFLVVAVDNKGDRAAYVGPVYSYYEFPSGVRLTDEAWRARIREGTTPHRPAWTKAFRAAGKERDPVP